MNLVKELWTTNDIPEFQAHLESFGRPEKVEWTTNIINTKKPALAVLSKDIAAIVKEILKGNFVSFIDLDISKYIENTFINGNLICHIKDFDTLKKYLYAYACKAENWAECDLLSFKINAKNRDSYFGIAMEFAHDPKPFVRRVGISILFKMLEDKTYLTEIFALLNTYKDEEHYYVNMINAWLICDLFIKHRDETLEFFKTNNLNKFTVNKAISKCRDSYRVSADDKELLLQFKQK